MTDLHVKSLVCRLRGHFKPRLLSLAILLVTPSAAALDYRLDAVAAGVFVHRPADPLAGPVDGNMTIITGSRGVAVVDTHIDPAAARAAIEAIKGLTEQPVTHIVNTHWHDDHVNGNATFLRAFPRAQVIAHEQTLSALKREWPKAIEQRQQAYPKVDPDALRAKSKALRAQDPLRAIDFTIYADYVERLTPELPQLSTAYPNQTFTESLAVDLGGRELTLQWLGPGNTQGDTVVWLPKERILITGDLLVAPVPFAFSAPMLHWPVTLQRLRAYPFLTLIPGHGAPMSDIGHVDSIEALIKDTLKQVDAARRRGMGKGQLPEAVDLANHAERFAGNDPRRQHAWHRYYLHPGLISAWDALESPP